MMFYKQLLFTVTRNKITENKYRFSNKHPQIDYYRKYPEVFAERSNRDLEALIKTIKALCKAHNGFMCHYLVDQSNKNEYLFFRHHSFSDNYNFHDYELLIDITNIELRNIDHAYKEAKENYLYLYSKNIEGIEEEEKFLKLWSAKDPSVRFYFHWRSKPFFDNWSK